MHVVVNSGELAAALKVVSPAVAGRTSIPVLSHVLLDARDGRLTLSATNLETALRTSVTAEVETPGRTTTSESRLSGWVSLQLDSSQITLKADAKGITVTAGRDRIRLGVADADDFPPLPDVDGETYEVAAALLSAGLAATLPSVAHEDSRPILSGLLFSFFAERLDLVGADGLRLGFSTFDLGDPVASSIALVVPRKSIETLRKVIPSTGNVTVRVGVRLAQVAFRAGDTELFSRLLEGQFPDWRRVVPTEFKTSVTVKAADITRQIKAAQLIGKNVAVRVGVDPDLNTITVRAYEDSDAHEGVLDAEIRGEAVDIALDGAQALTAIEALGADAIEFGFNLASQTMVLFNSENKTTGFQVLQPRHVNTNNRAIREVAA